MRPNVFVLGLLTYLLMGMTPAMAQQSAPAAESPSPVGLTGRMLLPRDILSPEGAPLASEVLAARTLLFTPVEIDSIVATLLRVNRRPANNSEAQPTGPDENGLLPGMPGYVEPLSEEAVPSYPPIPTKRTITLSGVLLRKPGDWVVWLNGHKLVPGQLLPEIVGMSVERDRVHLKWFDIGLGKVISLTLRPNQTYDVTSGLLLSGERVE